RGLGHFKQFISFQQRSRQEEYDMSVPIDARTYHRSASRISKCRLKHPVVGPKTIHTNCQSLIRTGLMVIKPQRLTIKTRVAEISILNDPGVSFLGDGRPRQ